MKEIKIKATNKKDKSVWTMSLEDLATGKWQITKNESFDDFLWEIKEERLYEESQR